MMDVKGALLDYEWVPKNLEDDKVDAIPTDDCHYNEQPGLQLITAVQYWNGSEFDDEINK